MFSKKVISILIGAAVLMSLVSACGGTNNKQAGSISGVNTTPKTSNTSEPTLKSTNETKTWPGASLVVTFDYKAELAKEQVVVNIGGQQAAVESCSENQVRIKSPNGLPSGNQAITATVDDKQCKGELSIEVAAPVIDNITPYTMGSSIDIEVHNIQNDSDIIKVYVDDKELAYAKIKDMGKAGKYAVNVEVPKGTKAGEVYITYGVNKSNAMKFTME